MAKEVVRQYLPLMDEEGRGAAIEYRWVLKAAGQDTVVAGPTGCMYVANSTYLCTPYTVPWAHTPIASGGAFTPGMAGGYQAADQEGPPPGPVPEHHHDVRRRQRRGHRARPDLRRPVPQP